MRLYRTALLTVLMITVTSVAKAQFDGLYSQYMSMKQYYNPAAIGEQDMMRVLVAQRLDWIGIKNSPKTTLLTVATPFKIGQTTHAGGLEFISDVYGIFANQQFNLQYAYRFKFEDYGVLSVGANIGMINLICYGDSVHMVESEYHTPSNSDPAIPIGTQSGVGFDMGVGVHFSAKSWYAGIGLLHAPGANVRLGDKYRYKVRQTLAAMGGYNWQLQNELYTLKPSVALYSDFTTWQLQISLLLDYKGKFWGGLAYSIQDAVSIIFGAEIIAGLRIGYNYDLPASAMIRVTHGSHELFISYDFDIFGGRQESKYKSIRLL